MKQIISLGRGRCSYVFTIVLLLAIFMFLFPGCFGGNNPIGSHLRIKQTELDLEEFRIGDNQFLVRFEVPGSLVYKESDVVFDFCKKGSYEFFFPPQFRLKIADGRCQIFYGENLIVEGAFRQIRLEPFSFASPPSLEIDVEGYCGYFTYEIEEFSTDGDVLEIPFRFDSYSGDASANEGVCRLLILANWYNYGMFDFPSVNLNKGSSRGVYCPPPFSR